MEKKIYCNEFKYYSEFTKEELSKMPREGLSEDEDLNEWYHYWDPKDQRWHIDYSSQ